MNFVVNYSGVVYDKVHGVVRIEIVHDKVYEIVGEVAYLSAIRH